MLYCILKGNVSNRQKFAYSLINPSLRRLVRNYRNRIVHGGYSELSEEEYSIYHEFFRNVSKLSEDELLVVYERIKSDILNESINFNAWREEHDLALTRKIDRQIEVIEKNDNDLFLSILKRVLASEFYSLKLFGSFNIKGHYNEQSFKYSIGLKNSIIESSSLEGFFSLSDVNYIDSISILDINYFRFRDSRRNERTNHVLSNLNDDSESLEFLEEERNKKIIYVQNKIIELINGKFGNTGHGFAFISNEGHETSVGDTSSGIKQIGIIQMLLDNRKLKEGSFLIIDEPEVNLHPEWQIKFAEVLCILARDLNVHVYINTHSPMFIEAMSIYSEYYFLKDETNFYLTKKLGKGFTFEKIANDDMGAVYENLSRPYDDLDKIKAKLLHRI